MDANGIFNFIGFVFIAMVILIIVCICKCSKQDKIEAKQNNAIFRCGCEYIGGIPLLDEKNYMNYVMNLQVRPSSLYIDYKPLAEIDIPINNIRNMEVKTRQQIINKEVSPSLGKFIAFGVFALGMKDNTQETLTDKYLIVTYIDKDTKERIFAMKTNYAENFIREVKKLKGEEYTVNIKNYI